MSLELIDFGITPYCDAEEPDLVDYFLDIGLLMNTVDLSEDQAERVSEHFKNQFLNFLDTYNEQFGDEDLSEYDIEEH